MAVLSDNGFPTLVNILKRTDPAGKILALAEMLDQELDFYEDIPWVEGNLPTGHLLAQRSALPSASALWRGYNEGASVLKSDNATFTEVCGMMEGRTLIDERLAALNGNSMEFRNSEARAVAETFAQEMARAIFYESVVANPKKIHGLTARYPATSGYTASNYVIKLGTTTTTNPLDCHSVWLITWEPGRIYGIYPKGSSAGLRREDKGLVTITDAKGKRFDAWEEKFAQEAGLAVEDYRYAVRMQWDMGDTQGVPDAGKTFYLGLDRMLNTIKRVTGNARFYMDRTSLGKLTSQLANNAQSSLEWANVNGTPIPKYRGIPIRVTDALVAEAAIS